MNYEDLRAIWRGEEQAAFSGWDFSHLDGRWHSEPLPWDYEQLVLDCLKPSHRLLDMGTGGGEFLLSLGHPYENTDVTEAWAPNVTLCQERLAPLGIGVYQVFDDTRLPFDDNTFDIVINRHESYDPGEVARILKPGGLFLTQQVGGENNRLLSEKLLPGQPPAFPGFSLGSEVPKFEAAGFAIVFRQEAFPALRYFDVGAVVYYAKVVEWEYPHFTVDSSFTELCALQQKLDEKGFIESREHRFIIAGKKNM